MKNSATRAAASAPPAPQSAASRLADRSGVSLQTFEQCCDGHNDSPDQQRPRPSNAEEKRDSEIANEMVELPTKLGARGPFGRTESRGYKQDHNGHAANFCTGTKPRFHIGAHRNTLASKDSTVRQKLAYMYFRG